MEVKAVRRDGRKDRISCPNSAFRYHIKARDAVIGIKAGAGISARHVFRADSRERPLPRQSHANNKLKTEVGET